MNEQLIAHIQRLLPGINIPVKQIAPYLETRKIKKGELLLAEHEVSDRIYFVNKGCLYLFYHLDDELQVIHFALENWWITDYKTFCDGLPAVYGIAALEDSEVTSISRADYEALQLRLPVIAIYFNKIHERAYGAALYKQQTYATVSRPDFYRYFLNTYPDVIRRIPDDIFAAYMGISLAALLAIKADLVS